MKNETKPPVMVVGVTAIALTLAVFSYIVIGAVQPPESVSQSQGLSEAQIRAGLSMDHSHMDMSMHDSMSMH